jgi:LuxR family transcriptional regulator, maltose regulon positive regulatory protein
MPSDQHAGAEAGHSPPSAPVEDLLRSTARVSAIPPGTVLRHRLLDLVNQGVQRPLTLVSAHAGFGKTMLLDSWEAVSAGPAMVRHIALDGTSDQAAAVLESVLDGLHRRGSALFEEPVLFVPEDKPGEPPRSSDAVLEQDVLVLVLDCGDLTMTPELGQSLHRLISGNAGRVRVVLLTRSDPPLPLHLYRLAGTVAEIRAADLAFTMDEAAGLMRHQKLDLAPSEVSELHDRTDGWPAGLMFAAMGLAGKTDTEQAIREFRGDTGNIAAYLMTEVLNAQPAALREFMLRTSIVDEVRPALAEALTGRPCDSRSLEFMSRGNTFIQPVPGTDDCYSYQPLFREFLRAQLSFERPGLNQVLHRTAADWFAQNGQRLDAIRHAVTAHQWGDAARLLVEGLDFAGLLVGRRRRLLTTLFADLPDDLGGADAAVVRAAQALTAFDVTRCTSELSKAQESLDAVSTQPPLSELAITVLQAVSTSLGADVDAGLDAAVAAEWAVRQASPGPAVAHPELTLLVAGCKGRVLLQRGDFQASLAAFTEGIAVAEAAGAHEALADFLGMAALVEAVWGHLRQAAETAAHATALAESGAQPHEPQSAMVAEAWVRTDQGDLTGARELVHRAAEAAPTYDAHVLAAALALVRARLLRSGGDADLAGAELRAASNSYGAQHDGWLGQSLIVDEAKILVAQHQPREAISVIEKSQGRDQVGSLLVLQRAATEASERGPALPPMAKHRTGPLANQVDGWLVQAAESIRTGDSGRSALCLERALRLAAPEQLRRPFSEAPPSVQRLLQPTGELMRRHTWLRAPHHLRDRVAGSSDHPSGRAAGELVCSTSLTDKEHEVLEYLAELLTTEEIASTMYISVNTVRSHVRSILRKLNASRRNEAVRRAWELGLLPSRPEF